MTQTTLFELENKKKQTSGTFKDNMKLPVHGWFRYTAGFSAEWVKSVFEKFPNSNSILDPFVGSGTVLLEGQLNSKEVYGVEAHSLVYKIAEAKLLWNIDADEFYISANRLLKTAQIKPTRKKIYPKLLQKIYAEQTLKDLFSLKRAWQNEDFDEDHRKLIWFLITSILRISSPAGTAQWQYVLPNKKKATVLQPFEAFKLKLNEVVSDMKRVQKRNIVLGETHLIKGDSRTLEGVPDDSIDLVITSPPYANNYDYADATRIELSFWHEIDNWGKLQGIVKHDIIRACTQHVAHLKDSVEELFEAECLEPIRNDLKNQFNELARVRLEHGGKKNYHLMALAYFKDLGETFQALRRVCKEDSDLCFVIGDSAPYSVYLPVDEWLGELAIGAGFNSYSFEKLRDRNIKWKNRKHRVPLKEGRLWIK